MIKRAEVIDHVDWVLRPPNAGQLIDEVINAIELAAAGRDAETIEIGCERMTVMEAVEIWELDGLVERVKDGETVRHGPDLEYIDGSWRSLRDDAS